MLSDPEDDAATGDDTADDTDLDVSDLTPDEKLDLADEIEEELNQ